MRVELLQSGRVLRNIRHDGENWVEAPPEGDYQIRLTNDSPGRKLAVLSVDGINAIDGKDAGYGGSGYIVGPFRSVTIQGWIRSGSEAAKFQFTPAGESYAAATSRGEKNVGVVGVAVFGERPAPIFKTPVIETTIIHEHHHYGGSWWGERGFRGPSVTYGPGGDAGGGDGFSYSSSVPTTASVPGGQDTKSARSSASPVDPCRGSSPESLVDVGTGYGGRVTMHTVDAEFQKASESPEAIVRLRYATRERLLSWGVPLDRELALPAPDPFPAAAGFVQPPPGWRG